MRASHEVGGGAEYNSRIMSVDKSGKVNQLVKETNGKIIVFRQRGGGLHNEAFGNIIKRIINNKEVNSELVFPPNLKKKTH